MEDDTQDVTASQTTTTTHSSITLSREEIETLVAAGLKRAFMDVGVMTLADSDIIEVRKDFAFLRDWRMQCDLVRKQGIVWGVVTVLGAVGLMLVMGVKGWIWSP